MIPDTPDRVPLNTDEAVNERIRRETERRLEYYARNPELIDARLNALDEEWDIERAIQANAAVFGLTGLFLGTTADRRWLALPGLVSAFLLQHAVQGWCPPVPVLRRLGFRTASEIERERDGLRALRGDYDAIAGALDRLKAILQAVRLRPVPAELPSKGALPHA